MTPAYCPGHVSRLVCREVDLDRAWKFPQVEDGAGKPGKPI